MKGLAFALGASLLMVTVLVAPALGAAQKVALEPAVAFPGNPGGGFVVFNNSAGPENLHFTVALKGVLPDTAYDIYHYVDTCGLTSGQTPDGTVTTNSQGNATLHVNTSVPAGTHQLGIDVVYQGLFADQYLSDNFTDACNPGPGSATLTFK
jgi:hypothetical protein